MKKFLVLSAFITLLAACGNKAVSTSDENVASDSIEVVVDSCAVDTLTADTLAL